MTYREKSEQKERADARRLWRQEDVPWPCVIRPIIVDMKCLVIGTDAVGLEIKDRWLTWEQLYEDWEWSPDGKEPWRKCGRE